MKTKYIVLVAILTVGLFGANNVFARDYDIPAQRRQVVDRVIIAKEKLLYLFQTKKLRKLLSDRQIAAIIWVESNNGKNVIGDDGKALGPLQLWDIYVSDVNDLCGTYINNINCIRDRELSILVMLAYMNKYAKNSSFEEIARIHNGGPKGHLKDATKKYYSKVIEEYNSLEPWMVRRMIPQVIVDL